MTGKSNPFAATAVFMNRQKNLMIFNFTIFPSNLKKERKKKEEEEKNKKKNKTNKNLCVFKSFQYINSSFFLFFWIL